MDGEVNTASTGLAKEGFLTVVKASSGFGKTKQNAPLLYGGQQGQYKNMSPSIKMLLPIQKYFSQYKNIYRSTKMFLRTKRLSHAALLP